MLLNVSVRKLSAAARQFKCGHRQSLGTFKDDQISNIMLNKNVILIQLLHYTTGNLMQYDQHKIILISL